MQSLEREADEHGPRAAHGEPVAYAGRTGPRQQRHRRESADPAQWLPSPYNKMFYEWDKVLDGLRSC
jgi:hypothetical protein